MPWNRWWPYAAAAGDVARPIVVDEVELVRVSEAELLEMYLKIVANVTVRVRIVGP